MKSRNIANIVFYKYFDGSKTVTKCTVFYKNGEIVNGEYEDGIAACEELAKELHITSKSAFREMVNRNIVHVMSGKDFTEQYSRFVKESRTAEVVEPVKPVKPSTAAPVTPVAPVSEDDTAFDSSIEDENVASISQTEKPKKEGFFTKVKNFFKKPIRVAACVVAGIIGLSLYGCSKRESKVGQMKDSNLALAADNTLTADANKALNNNGVLLSGNNDYYDDYTFSQLQEVNTKKNQKEAMDKLYTFMNDFNGRFADAYVEEGKDVRAALTFDEVVALQQAYNDFGRNSIKAIFNGADIRADKMARDYKVASLQLMDAYIIENSKNKVDVTPLLETEEAKEFYNRYHDMFLAAKEETDKEAKIAKVSAFYKAVRADFPITQEVRTEGTVHADAYNDIEAYKLSVTPMIAAAEALFQNLEVDNTLNDSEIDFLNDIGLCNYAERTFERIETIALSSDEDEANPLYDQYRDSIIEELKGKGQYVIDDYHRELFALDSFQNAINWHFEIVEEVSETGSVSTKVVKSTRTESHTTYSTKETRTEKPIPESEKKKIDDQIAAENEKAKQEGEQAASEKAKELQAQEDEKGKQIHEEVERENQDFQQKLDEANQKIDENNKDNDPTNDTPVHESDFGDHNVHFDEQHSDGNGNLDPSVKDLTTDPTGDQTGNPLPDPNETGAKFDAIPQYVEPQNDQNYYVYEYNEPVSYESAVDQYINNLAGATSEYEGAYQYTLN